ncbi:MAG: tetratricopeptide repeat protein [Planctomycetota bacterium]
MALALPSGLLGLAGVCGALVACGGSGTSASQSAAGIAQEVAQGERSDAEHLARGLALLRADRFTAALPELRAAVSAAPEDPVAWVGLARTLTAIGELQEADQAYAHARTFGPPRAALLCEQGLVREQLGDVAGARALFEASLVVQPTLSTSHLRLALFAEREGDHAASAAGLAQYARWAAVERARDDLRVRADAAPSDLLLKLRLVELELELERPDEASALTSRVLARDAGNADALRLGGVAALQAGRHAEARDLLQAAALAAPRDPRPRFELARAYAALGEQRMALAALNEARARGATAYEYGLVAWELGDAPRALASFDEHLAFEPKDVDARFAKGQVFAAVEQWPEAISNFEAALALAPARADILSALRDARAVWAEEAPR